MFVHNVCEILLILIVRWVAQSLKKFEKLTLEGPKSREPFRLKPIDHKKKAPTTPKFKKPLTAQPINVKLYVKTLTNYSFLHGCLIVFNFNVYLDSRPSISDGEKSMTRHRCCKINLIAWK
jgi:hypothetical protein